MSLRILVLIGSLALFFGPRHLEAAGARSVTGASSHGGPGLVLYAAEGYDADVAKAFQQQTGIKVQVVDDSTGPLLAKMALQSIHPQWDLIWVDGSTTLLDLDNRGYFAHYRSPSVTNYNGLGRSFLPSDDAYFPTGVTVAGAIVYDKTRVGSTPLPRTWQDLEKPVYRNMVTEADPAFSGPAFPFICGIMQTLGSVEAGERYFLSLRTNGDKLSTTNGPTLQAVESGQRKFAIVQDSAAFGDIATGHKLGVIYPTSGVVALPGVIGIDKRAPHLKAAERFVDWLLTRNGGQRAMIRHDRTDGDSYFRPVIQGVTGHLKDQAGLRLMHLKDDYYAPRAEMIRIWFHLHMTS